MKRIRIMLVIGTRPEAVKMAPLAHALAATPWADLKVLATAQHRAMLDSILAFFEVPVHVDLDLMQPSQSLAGLMGRMLPAVDQVLAEQRPALVVAQGDTSTVLAAALAAFYRKIPFAHVEAGLRTGQLDSPFPEEMNRVVTSRLAALHFAPTTTARDHLLSEGIAGDRVHMTGNTVIDALLWAAARRDGSRWQPAAGRRLVLVTAHRRENFGAPLRSICAALERLAARGDVDILYPVHPNPEVAQVVKTLLGHVKHVRLVEPLDYPDFVAAMQASHLILSDSGGVQEEAPSLGKPVLVLRESTERPEGIVAGTARLVGAVEQDIVAAATELLDDDRAYRLMAKAKNPYGDGQAAGRIVLAMEEFVGATSGALDP